MMSKVESSGKLMLRELVETISNQILNTVNAIELQVNGQQNKPVARMRMVSKHEAEMPGTFTESDHALVAWKQN